jgi:hypothetical protein
LSFVGTGTVTINELHSVTPDGDTSRTYGLNLYGTQKLTLTGTSYIKSDLRLVNNNTLLRLEGHANVNAASKVYASNAGAASINNSSVRLENLSWATGTLGGTGANLSSKGVLATAAGDGYRIAPGDIGSVGKLSFTGGNLVWDNGASTVTYDWQYSSLSGAAGVGYDQIYVDGALNLGGGTLYNLNLISLGGADFDLDANPGETWDLIATTGGISNFDLAKWTVALPGDVILSLSADSKNLQLIMIPEPAAWLLLVIGSGLLAVTLRRPRRA